MAAPLDHLPDAQGIKYRLQLNVYRFILEKYYGFVVSSMLVVCLHPDLEVPFVEEVPHMPTETCEIMALRCRPGTELSADVLGAGDMFLEDGPTFEEAIQEEEQAEELLLSQPFSLAGPSALSHATADEGGAEADALGGAEDAEADGFPHLGEAPDEAMDMEPAALAPAVAEEVAPSQPQTAPKEEIDGDVDNMPLEDTMFEKLRQRRLWPGAATSAADFATMFSSLEDTNGIFQEQDMEPLDNSDTILHKVKLWTDKVREYLGQEAPDYLVRMLVGVLAFGRSRQADIFVREHALVYWIAEGGRTLRFHAGDCFMKTPSGAFQQHRGVPPDHDRVQAFLLHVEGVFRLMPRTTPRTTTGFLEAVSKMWEDHGRDLKPFVGACIDACLSFEGDVARRGRAAVPPADREFDGGDGQEPDLGQPQSTWNASTAKTIMAVKKHLSMELTQDKLLHYMSEWCDGPKQPEAAVCYDDCAITYEDELLPAVQVRREKLQNCYLRIPHCIKGTVPGDVWTRLKKFYTQSFWGNVTAFRCCQAAQALAKRGLNVVRLFIGLSGGGVGQSLFSAHLQAMYGHNFAFFDPQIWFNEEEMRKQVGNLNGCIILTGQETPGTKRVLAAGTAHVSKMKYSVDKAVLPTSDNNVLLHACRSGPRKHFTQCHGLPTLLRQAARRFVQKVCQWRWHCRT